MKRLINKRPSKPLAVFLGIFPFLILLFLYQVGSDARKAENERDKLLPSFSEIHHAIDRLAFTPSKRTGEYVFWQDTKSSLKRMLMGLAIAALIGLTIGLLTGAIPMLGANLTPLVTAISLIPPMAILPILFIVFGLGELSKVVLIVIGIAPFMTRDIYQRTKELPREQLVKAQTLGAHSGQIIVRVLLPQILPRLIDAVRLSLGSAWLFLIAAEAIASTDGLGYRIFLVRRYMSMDVILPYVIWITFLAFLLDWMLVRTSKTFFPWYHVQK
ncbi:ABC transporter permease [Saccharophagus degradans]|uniref:Binding-protein-dependent transport systems inner membrane component n=1 Tax=Saccharophagus degradans (strain 2-40 / ATCC 43961 / DSM 17024) TaxID=203122 RepID=Q21LP4_SACD2|nr:ABC transporter permease [Saccharophagus degradans]ABD80385.1 binding-protein-dependent transport systems inner membrane component [Saccharophagus degradans 2-40]